MITGISVWPLGDVGRVLGVGLFISAGLGALVVALLALYYGKFWLQAYMSSARVRFSSLVGMSFRQVEIGRIVRSKIILTQAGIHGIRTSDLEAHYLAGGDLASTVHAVVAANRSGIELSFDRASAIDLAGRNVLEAVQTFVTPVVIHCPDSNLSIQAALTAVAKDGVELKIQARVTVRTNIDLLIGGATESTIIARIGQGIVSAVGMAHSHSDVLREPESISKRLIYQGLDSNTVYSIVSIDIVRIDVGENIGARIRTDQAEADMRVSQSLSESRRVEALAWQQEMRALVKSKEAELVLAESLIPRAVANAIRQGRVGNENSSNCRLLAGLAFDSAKKKGVE